MSETRDEIDNIEEQIEDGKARQAQLNSLLITKLNEFYETYESQEVSDERQEEAEIDDESYRKMKELAVEVSAMAEGYGMNVYGAILRLREYDAMGKSVYMDINGTRVYSCEVTTMDNGCKAYKGKNWDESKEKMSELDEAKVKYFIARGKEYIYPEKMGEWKEFVDVIARTNSISTVKLTLDLMEKLESGAEISEVKELYGQHDGDIRNIILHFSKRGPEFYENTAHFPLKESKKEELAYRRAENERLEELHREDNREDISDARGAEIISEIDNIEEQIEDRKARQAQLNSLLITKLNEFYETYESQEVSDERQEEAEIDDESYRKMKELAVEVSAMAEGYGMNVYGAILRLREYDAMGKSVYMDINGTRVYSCEVTTMDNGCKAYKGKNWDESKEKMSELDEAKVKYFIARGKEYIYPEKMGEWKEFVDVIARTNSISTVKLTLDLMEKLESGAEISEVKELYGQHDGDIRNIILHFSKRGPEFYENTAHFPLKESKKEELAYRRAENERLEELHREDNREDVSDERQAEEAEIRDMTSDKKALEEEIAKVQAELEETMRKAQELIAKLGNLNQQRGGLGE